MKGGRGGEYCTRTVPVHFVAFLSSLIIHLSAGLYLSSSSTRTAASAAAEGPSDCMRVRLLRCCPELRGAAWRFGGRDAATPLPAPSCAKKLRFSACALGGFERFERFERGISASASHIAARPKTPLVAAAAIAPPPPPSSGRRRRARRSRSRSAHGAAIGAASPRRRARRRRRRRR